MKVDSFLDVICDTLGRDPGTITLADSPDTIEEWDSVGHLSIIFAADEELGVPTDEIEALRNFTTIRQLVDCLMALEALEE